MAYNYARSLCLSFFLKNELRCLDMLEFQKLEHPRRIFRVSDMVQVDMKQWFGNLVFNVLVRIISGKRFQLNDEEGVQFQNVARKFLELLGTFVVSDFVPFMNLSRLICLCSEIVLIICLILLCSD
ncbi:putative cytochrome P450 superfamily [Helianthus annuus]|uniref:Cytochrome P450 superfamily n=1 Tax=Helianthus annuus TaxID=4232 RepID=A0A9K3DP64_HELAN|nr:putative cytochrome P450 superfamily [Helianthus annuus]